jgi:predicted DNA-binding transcriptional regulator
VESYGSYLKRMFGRALLIAALVVFFWVWWIYHAEDERREARDVSLGNRAVIEEIEKQLNER